MKPGATEHVIHCNSQSLDTAVQHCEEVLQSFIGVTGDQTDGR